MALKVSIIILYQWFFLLLSDISFSITIDSFYETFLSLYLLFLVIQTIEAEQKFTGLGFFVVDRAALTSILGTAVTYCVIVVQGITIYNKILDKEKDQKCCPQIWFCEIDCKLPKLLWNFSLFLRNIKSINLTLLFIRIWKISFTYLKKICYLASCPRAVFKRRHPPSNNKARPKQVNQIRKYSDWN